MLWSSCCSSPEQEESSSEQEELSSSSLSEELKLVSSCSLVLESESCKSPRLKPRSISESIPSWSLPGVMFSPPTRSSFVFLMSPACSRTSFGKPSIENPNSESQFKE